MVYACACVLRAPDLGTLRATMIAAGYMAKRVSCNALAAEIDTNAHCLLRSFDEARELIESGKFDGSEPGPFRIFGVYSVDWPRTSAAARSSTVNPGRK